MVYRCQTSFMFNVSSVVTEETEGEAKKPALSNGEDDFPRGSAWLTVRVRGPSETQERREKT